MDRLDEETGHPVDRPGGPLGGHELIRPREQGRGDVECVQGGKTESARHETRFFQQTFVGINPDLDFCKIGLVEGHLNGALMEQGLR